MLVDGSIVVALTEMGPGWVPWLTFEFLLRTNLIFSLSFIPRCVPLCYAMKAVSFQFNLS